MVGTCQYAETKRWVDSQIFANVALKIARSALGCRDSTGWNPDMGIAGPVFPLASGCIQGKGLGPQMNLQPLYDWIFHQRPDGTALSMKAVGMVLGVALLLFHLWALLRAERARALAKIFPRHRASGIVLLTACL